MKKENVHGQSVYETIIKLNDDFGLIIKKDSFFCWRMSAVRRTRTRCTHTHTHRQPDTQFMSFLCLFRIWFFFLLPENWNRWPKQRGNVSILKVLTAARHPSIYSFTISHLPAPTPHAHTKLLSYVHSIVKWFNKIMTFWRITFLLHQFCVLSFFCISAVLGSRTVPINRLRCCRSTRTRRASPHSFS